MYTHTHTCTHKYTLVNTYTLADKMALQIKCSPQTQATEFLLSNPLTGGGQDLKVEGENRFQQFTHHNHVLKYFKNDKYFAKGNSPTVI